MVSLSLWIGKACEELIIIIITLSIQFNWAFLFQNNSIDNAHNSYTIFHIKQKNQHFLPQQYHHMTHQAITLFHFFTYLPTPTFVVITITSWSSLSHGILPFYAYVFSSISWNKLTLFNIKHDYFLT